MKATATAALMLMAGLACGASSPSEPTDDGTTAPSNPEPQPQPEPQPNVPRSQVSVDLQGSGIVDVVTQTGTQKCEGGCTTQVIQGGTVLLVPHPADGYTFEGFQSAQCNDANVQGSNDCNLIVNGDLTVIVNFKPVPPPKPEEAALVVMRTGNGSCVVKGPAAGIDCGSDCQGNVARDTTVALAVAPDKDSAFVGWDGSCQGKDPTCAVKMDKDRTVSARCMQIVCSVDP